MFDLKMELARPKADYPGLILHLIFLLRMVMVKYAGLGNCSVQPFQVFH